MHTFSQSYVGQVNVAGDCYCFGATVHLKAGKAILAFLSVTGASSSVEALWARMAQGKASTIVRDNKQPAIPLEPQEKGMYTRIQKKVDGLGIDHLLLFHRELSEPWYTTMSQTEQLYLRWPNETPGVAKLGEHVQKTVNVAVFDEWFVHLHREGRVRGLVRSLHCFGGVEVVHVMLDPKRWTGLTADGLKRSAITNFRVTVNKNFRSQDGERTQKTTWFNAALWGERGENLVSYLKKGTLVLVTGEVSGDCYPDKKTGKPVASLKITVDWVQLLSPKPDEEPADAEPGEAEAE